MSEERASSQPDTASASTPPSPKLRTRPFGYRKEDVREALGARDAELDARAGELAELRQDVAALWLAFAQHDRMIRSALAGAGGAPEAPTQVPAEGAEASPAASPDPAIGRQLSELDEVLAAIELATQTLERTYAGEVAETDEREGPTAEPAPDEPGGEDEAT